jgi:hypothetical protein
MRIGSIRRAQLAIPVVVLSFAGCDTRLDLDQPITLVPGPGWGQIHLAQMRDAANAWNSAFGTSLWVSNSLITEQQVSIVWSDLVCGYANGVTRCFDGVEVQICTLDAISYDRFYEVLLHELGHVLNIREHAEDPLAVMHGEYSGEKTFRVEDWVLFDAANPDFVHHMSGSGARLDSP